MAEMWKPRDNETLKHWLDTIINEASDDLTDWEIKFIDDVSIRINNKWPLTRTQEEKLEEIYANKTE